MNLSTDSKVSLHRSANAGFSLIEMIGVLAIIAVLAVARSCRKVFSTIATSRITGAVSAVNSVGSACADFTGKYGPIPVTVADSRVDDLLLTAGYLDSRFSVKIGTPPANPRSQVPRGRMPTAHGRPRAERAR